MTSAANQDRVEFLTPMIRRCFLDLNYVISRMDPETVRGSLDRMATDPAEIVFSENGGTRAWDVYNSGGRLAPEKIELALSPKISSMSIQSLSAMLQVLGTDSAVSLHATSKPWCFEVRGPKLPRVSVETYPMMEPIEDLAVRVVLGSRAAYPLPGGTVLRDLMSFHSTGVLKSWVAVNQARPLVNHPAFDQIVEPPANGVPGIYLIRVPPFPYSSMLPAQLYRTKVTWAVVETADELASCQAYYRTPGASFFTKPPFFRNQPPCSLQPAQLAGGIVPNSVLMVHTSWETSKTVVVYTLPDDLLRKSPELRRTAYRGRYLVAHGDDDAQALTAVGLPNLNFWGRTTGFVH